MVESHVAASTIKLLPSLQYGASEVAPYLLGRSAVSFSPSGASVYGGSVGSKVCRMEISASVGAMLDLRSLYVSATVFNTGSLALKFLSPSLSGCLASARIILAGVEVSSCDYIARTEHLMSQLQSTDDRRADFEAGFGITAATA